MDKTIDLMKCERDKLLNTVNLINELENLRSTGRCKLVKNSNKDDDFIFATICISFDINLSSILPADILQYGLTIADLKNDKLRLMFSQMFPNLLKISYKIDQFTKKHQTVLQNLNGNYLEEIDKSFLTEFADLFSDYFSEIGPVLRYREKINNMDKSLDWKPFESLKKELNGNIDINHKINITTRKHIIY